jgi:hypothetical protein
MAGRLQGPLQIHALRAALQALEERHETLRTTFKERNGTPVQVIQPCRPAHDTLRLIDIAVNANFHEELHRQQTTAFDFQSTPPWRVALLRLGAEDHVLSIVMHHIISDGWSYEVLRGNLATFYSAACAGRSPLKELEPLAIQYRDFVAWHQKPINRPNSRANCSIGPSSSQTVLLPSYLSTSRGPPCRLVRPALSRP